MRHVHSFLETSALNNITVCQYITNRLNLYLSPLDKTPTPNIPAHYPPTRAMMCAIMSWGCVAWGVWPWGVWPGDEVTHTCTITQTWRRHQDLIPSHRHGGAIRTSYHHTDMAAPTCGTRASSAHSVASGSPSPSP